MKKKYEIEITYNGEENEPMTPIEEVIKPFFNGGKKFDSFFVKKILSK